MHNVQGLPKGSNLQHKVKELNQRMETHDIAVILETGTNELKKSETCHDDMVIDREYKMIQGD